MLTLSKGLFVPGNYKKCFGNEYSNQRICCKILAQLAKCCLPCCPSVCILTCMVLFLVNLVLPILKPLSYRFNLHCNGTCFIKWSEYTTYSITLICVQVMLCLIMIEKIMQHFEAVKKNKCHCCKFGFCTALLPIAGITLFLFSEIIVFIFVKENNFEILHFFIPLPVSVFVVLILLYYPLEYVVNNIKSTCRGNSDTSPV